MEEEKPYTVSTYIELLNATISHLSADIVGEISEIKIATSGHAYFTLKDKETGNILPCTIWGRDYALIGLKLELGMEILVKGKPNFYGPFGKLSFIAKHAELVGEGALKKAYDKLKKKLTDEGLFEISKKRPIPLFPQTIGVITSLKGAVIHDFCNNLKKIGFKVIALDSKVEGPESGKMLTLAVRSFKKEKIDVLVLIRGGGSMQSLAGFDNEALVREIASFPVPVITGIGHHQDVPLATLVADASESTPSLVAILLSKSWGEAINSLNNSQNIILNRYQDYINKSSRCIVSNFSKINSFLINILDKHKKIKQLLKNAVLKVSLQIRANKEKLEDKKDYIFKTFYKSVTKDKPSIMRDSFKEITTFYSNKYRNIISKLESIGKLINSNDPERQLKLGYSIIQSNNRVVKSTKDVKIGQEVEISVYDGKILSEIKKIK